MWELLKLLGRIWHWIGDTSARWWNFFIKIFDQVWAAWLLVLGVIVTVWKFGGVMLKAAVDKLEAFTFPTVDGHLPSSWIDRVEFMNGIFPVSEGFAFLIVLLSLYVLVFFVKLFLKFRPRVLGM